MVSSSLRIHALCKRYGDFVALAPTSLDVAKGEFLTLLGPSGSGKTTLLSLIAGLAHPDEGRILIDGTDVTHSPAYARDIGVVFQNYALFPHMTIEENIAFPLKMRKVSDAEARRRTAEALEMVHLPHVAKRYPRELSGGQQQRIALARCIVYRPSIILMDEPLGALDKKLRDQMQLEIKRIHRELGTTIVYVTHDQEEAMTMSDRICLMNAGAIEQLGTPQDLYFRPRSCSSPISSASPICSAPPCAVSTARGLTSSSPSRPRPRARSAMALVSPPVSRSRSWCARRTSWWASGGAVVRPAHRRDDQRQPDAALHRAGDGGVAAARRRASDPQRLGALRDRPASVARMARGGCRRHPRGKGI